MNNKIFPLISAVIILTVSGMNVFAIKLLSFLLAVPKKNQRVFYISYISLLIAFLIPVFTLFLSWDIYRKILYPCVLFLTGLATFNFMGFFIYFLFKNKTTRNKEIILILISFILIIVDSIIPRIIDKVLPSFNPDNFYIKDINIFIGIVPFIYSYIFGNKFNNEYKELHELKNNLEIKIKERTMQLEQAKKKIKKISKQKDILYANLAHETKTPLTIINNNLSQYIEKHGKTKEIMILKKYIDKLKRDMINFFDMEKNHYGKILYYHDQITDFSELLIKKIDLFKYPAQKKR